MARSKKPPVSGPAALTPNAVVVKDHGQDILVPLDKTENAIQNMFLAARGRHLILATLKHWKEQDQYPSPKELNDIASAIKNIASVSAEIYDNSSSSKSNNDKGPASPVDELVVSFDELSKRPAEDAPNAGAGEPASGVEGETTAG